MFSDYICPFCYVGNARLNRLREYYDLKVSWCFLEIHPETSANGEAFSSLRYPSEKWRDMMAGLKQFAIEEGLKFDGYTFTTNSRDALQLAEVAKFLDATTFYQLHNLLFSAFFTHGENIGERECLRRLALQAGLSEVHIEDVWNDKFAASRIAQYRQAAAELDVRATPTYFIGNSRLDGVVSFEKMFSTAAAYVNPA